MIHSFSLCFQNIEQVYLLIVFILSFGITVAGLEELFSQQIYSTQGLLSWNISKLGERIFYHPRYSSVCDRLFGPIGFKTLLSMRLLLAMASLLCACYGIISPFLICLLFICSILISLRTQFGLDGAHQMFLVILFALVIATLSHIPSKISSICLFFIAGELALSYIIAGISKLISPIWRKTHALHAIFSTKTYGHHLLYHLISKSKLLAYFLCWSTLCFECCFVFSILSAPLFISFIIIGILFHLSNAIFMGLNTFLFSFLAAYPAWIYCAFTIGFL